MLWVSQSALDFKLVNAGSALREFVLLLKNSPHLSTLPFNSFCIEMDSQFVNTTQTFYFLFDPTYISRV